MEWIYLAGSIASIVSVIGVMVSIAKRRTNISEGTFRKLFGILAALGFLGIGILTMTFSKSTTMETVGAAMTVTGTVLLFILFLILVIEKPDQI
jgi:Ca2+/Na+ antiporter